MPGRAAASILARAAASIRGLGAECIPARVVGFTLALAEVCIRGRVAASIQAHRLETTDTEARGVPASRAYLDGIGLPRTVRADSFNRRISNGRPVDAEASRPHLQVYPSDAADYFAVAEGAQISCTRASPTESGGGGIALWKVASVHTFASLAS